MQAKQIMTGVVLLLLLLLARPLLGQGGGYSLEWRHLGGGGQSQATSAGFSLGSTLGQAEAGAAAGAAFTLSSGFWTAAAPVPPGGAAFTLYLPAIVR